MKIIQKSDAETAARLHQPLQDLHAALYPKRFKPYDFQASLTFFRKMIEKENFLFLFAEEDGEAFGYLMAEIRERKENELTRHIRSVYVHHISVSKECRKIGLGTALIEEVFQIAADCGINRIELDFWSGNGIAQTFYRKLGFKNIREYVYKDI